ncbi:PepSY-associated TM helix domain-containing protein [Nisaea nitritireducens]|uniref:PepSY-associated TM helix domain-containing protein n=1 Tax=Nisaea nitritireducens TaxID=568392 RepID=UPI0018671360|nr:PepSY-associated TM helix domain-containing protein [Nisaea nitritireducens]
MAILSTEQTKRLFAIHGWSGAILGLLLYVVALTGALAVFAAEIGNWANSGSDHHDPLARWVGVATTKVAADIPDEYKEEISISYDHSGDLWFFFHTHAKNAAGRLEEKGVMVSLDTDTHEVLSWQEGFRSELFSVDAADALTRFFVDLHINLHVPHPWGLYLTGLLGFVMLAAAISGFLLHRHFIRDLFLAPRLSSGLLRARDRHILAGSWGLLFAIILAFTGAFFSFATSLGLPVVATVAFGGDQAAMVEAVIGAPEAEDSRPKLLVSLDGVLRQSSAMAGTRTTFVSIEHLGRADARISVFHEPVEGGFRRSHHVFDGTTGIFLGSPPTLGAVPSAGDTVFGVMSALHFGTFAGFLSRMIWFGLGLAMAYVTVTGLQLWLKRRADDPAWQRVGRLVLATVYGLPIATCGAALAFFVSLPLQGTGFWTPTGFLISSAACLAIAWWIDDAHRLRRLCRMVLGGVLFALPMVRFLISGDGWIRLLTTQNSAVIVLDFTLLLAGAGLLYVTCRAASEAPSTSRASEAAE